MADVRKYGDYNIHPNSTFKRFFKSEAELDKFIAANPSRTYTKTSIEIPNGRFDEMIAHDDADIGKAFGIDVFENPEFYDWFDEVLELP